MILYKSKENRLIQGRYSKQGFTLFELIGCLGITMMIIVFYVVGVGGIIMGNFWLNESSALKAIQFVDSSVVEILMLERYIWSYSRAIVADDDGNRHEFYLDTSILQNVKAIPASGT